jgi:outer membrane protein assembly factor BamA
MLKKKISTWKGCLVFGVLVFGGVCFAVDAGSTADHEKLRIGGVDTLGNHSISRPKVLSKVRARTGDMFNAASVAEDCDRIGHIVGVHTAYYNKKIVDNKVMLTFVVVEKRLIRSIAIKGNVKVKTGKLLTELTFRKGDYLDVFSAISGAKMMADYYQKKGYHFAEVKLNEEELNEESPLKVEITDQELVKLELVHKQQNRARVVYTITEGPRCRIKKVSFEGNDTISSKRLKKVPKTRPRKFMVVPAYYDRDQIDDDITRLLEAYKKLGYLNIQVGKEVTFSEDKKEGYVKFVIDEGPIFLVESVSVDSEPIGKDYWIIASEDKWAKWVTQPGLVNNEPYSDAKAAYSKKTTERGFRAEGYIDVKAEPDIKYTPDNKVIVNFIVDKGKASKIGMIEITGNKEVQERVIRSVLAESHFTPGNWWDAEGARGDGTGYLEENVKTFIYAKDVKITPGDPVEGSDFRDAQVSVAESQTGSIMFGVGAGTDLGIGGLISLDQRNFDINDWPESWKEFITGKAFKGAGQHFKISANPGTEQSSYLVSFDDSYFCEKLVTFEISASGFEREQESWDVTRDKAYVGFEKRYRNSIWRRGFAFRIENVKIDSFESGTPKEVAKVRGDNFLYGAKLFLNRGGYFDIAYEQVGGDFTFGLLSATQRWYKTLKEDIAGRKTTLETRIHGATVVGDAPTFEKFYAGGSTSIRGFDYRGVSTRGRPAGQTADGGDPVGSDWVFLANAEVAVPLETDALSWLFFVDTGVIDTGGVRASLGTGIQLLLPNLIGKIPIRLELAVPFVKDDNDDTEVFSFSVARFF